MVLLYAPSNVAPDCFNGLTLNATLYRDKTKNNNNKTVNPHQKKKKNHHICTGPPYNQHLSDKMLPFS